MYMRISVHIHNQEAIEYDAIIICHKRTTEASATWDELEDQIRTRAEKTLVQLTEANGPVSKVDTSVIVLGMCLEFYSRCYPNVTRDGQPVTIKEAVESMEHIVNALAAMELPSGVHQNRARAKQLRLLEEQMAYERDEP